MYSTSTGNWDISTVYTGGTLEASIGVGSKSSIGVGTIGSSIGEGTIGSSKEEGVSLSFSLPFANVMYSTSTGNWDISTVYTGGTLKASIGVGSNSSIGVGSIASSIGEGTIGSSKEERVSLSFSLPFAKN